MSWSVSLPGGSTTADIAWGLVEDDGGPQAPDAFTQMPSETAAPVDGQIWDLLRTQSQRRKRVHQNFQFGRPTK
ncbi:hypothetical protein [Rudaeicoccus suwonensis]|uniref:hypothetical protein n=1 Tax=Rudaeicoccus suwonensis TaxID=657409 RepID=UPI0011A4A01F|nr:hypothetical protein [Rudaeicoccus suwonensis]